MDTPPSTAAEPTRSEAEIARLVATHYVDPTGKRRTETTTPSVPKDLNPIGQERPYNISLY